MAQHIIVTEYNPRWPELFLREAELIIRFTFSSRKTRKTSGGIWRSGIICEPMRKREISMKS
jgi:hypothetical protein